MPDWGKLLVQESGRVLYPQIRPKRQAGRCRKCATPFRIAGAPAKAAGGSPPNGSLWQVLGNGSGNAHAPAPYMPGTVNISFI